MFNVRRGGNTANHRNNLRKCTNCKTENIGPKECHVCNGIVRSGTAWDRKIPQEINTKIFTECIDSPYRQSDCKLAPADRDHQQQMQQPMEK